MKAQLLPLIFLILLIGGVLLSYFFYNAFYGTKYEESISERYTVDTLRNEIERLKGYSKQANIYSAHQALREHACLGGQIGAQEWICNGPNNFPVEDSVECLEDYTLYYANVYLGNYSVLDTPITLIKKNFSSCEYDVDPEEVLNPPGVYDPKYYDEGNFWVNITDALVSVSGGNAVVNDDLDIDEFITRNRYWYLFRIFHEWAEDDVYSPCVCANVGCACGASSGVEECTGPCIAASERCAELALKDLQRRFNKTEVECVRTKPYLCCTQGIGPACLPPSNCLPWPNPCSSSCKHECIPPPPTGPICPAPNIILQGYYNKIKKYMEKFDLNLNPLPVVMAEPPPDCVCDYWYEARFATSHQFVCTDNYFHVPSDKGPVPMIFRVSAIAFWRDQDACKTTNPCICPDGATSCSQCHDTCCTSCY